VFLSGKGIDVAPKREKHPIFGDLLGEIANQIPSFHASEVAIADCVLSNPDLASSMNISQIADRSGTSVASVVRFCKTLGFKGYPEFRMALIGQLSRQTAQGTDLQLDGGITVDDSATEVIRKIAYADSLAIKTTAERLDVETFVKTVDSWETASTIGIIGFASSGYVAMDLQLKLNRLGKRSVAWTDLHTALTSISLLKKGDVLVAISHSGTTLDIIDVVSEFKAKGVTIVLITNALRSPATGLADLVLFTSARETTLRSGATASRIAQLTVVDCLCVSLAQRNWSQTKVALDESRAAVRRRSGKKLSESEKPSSRPKLRSTTDGRSSESK
jgi:DNA-binding MurR/RpiR family transcriptional regulator